MPRRKTPRRPREVGNMGPGEKPLPKGLMGRPTSMTPEVQEKILQNLREGNYKTTSAIAAGISPQCLRKWMQAGRRDPDSVEGRFYRKIRQAEKQGEAAMVCGINRAGENDWKAWAWILTHGRAKNRFKAIQSSEVSGPNGKPIATVSLEGLSDEELEALDRIAQRIGLPSPKSGDGESGEGEEGEE